jgi:hypothetical protein
MEYYDLWFISRRNIRRRNIITKFTIKNFSLSFARSKNGVLNEKAQSSLLKFFPIIVICNILYPLNYLVEDKFIKPNFYFVSTLRFPIVLGSLMEKSTF